MRDAIADFLSRDRLESILAALPGIEVSVLGDFFLDRYLVTDPSLSEISLETGLESRQVVQVRCSAGAAGTVTNNLSALGTGRICAIGVIGDDGDGYELRRQLALTRVDTRALISDAGRFTPTYTKPMVREAGGERELERLDIKNRTPLSAELEDRLLAEVDSWFRASGESPGAALIVLDQVQERNCGAITDRVRQRVGLLGAEYPRALVLVDSRVRIGEFRNVMIKPNRHEAAQAIGLDEARCEPGSGPSGTVKTGSGQAGDVESGHGGSGCWQNGIEETGRGESGNGQKGDDETGCEELRRGEMDLAEVCRRLGDITGRAVFLTAGERGIYTAAGARSSLRVRVPAIQAAGPMDIVGAGDSVTAGIVCALCAGATAVEAAALGNLCASVTVRKLGTTGTASGEEVRAAWEAAR